MEGFFVMRQTHTRLHPSIESIANAKQCRVDICSRCHWFLTVFLLAFLLGCGEKFPTSEINSDLADSSQTTPAQGKPTTSIVAPNKLGAATSPAEVTSPLPPVDAEPDIVCLRFMELLQSGDRVSAENLLTRTALTATSKAGLQLEPMGSSQARFEMGTIRYATIKNELAHVECEIVEPGSDARDRTPLTWVVRKQNVGWRIAGLVLKLAPDQPEDFLSFENIHDVEQIKNLAAAEFDSEVEAEARQANASLSVDGDAGTLK